MKNKFKTIINYAVNFYKSIRLQFHIKIKSFNCEIGWFHGNEFVVFNLKIYERPIEDFIVILSLQIFKFSISLYWSKL